MRPWCRNIQAKHSICVNYNRALAHPAPANTSKLIKLQPPQPGVKIIKGANATSLTRHAQLGVKLLFSFNQNVSRPSRSDEDLSRVQLRIKSRRLEWEMSKCCGCKETACATVSPVARTASRRAPRPADQSRHKTFKFIQNIRRNIGNFFATKWSIYALIKQIKLN